MVACTVARDRKPSPVFYEQVSREHLRALERVAERGSAARLKKLYESALAELERSSRALFRSHDLRDTFTAHQRRVVIAQLRAGIRALSIRMGEELAAHAREAATEGASTTVRNIHQLEAHYTGTTPVLPVEEASRFVGAYGPGRRSLLRDASMHGGLRISTSMARYGAYLVTGFEQDMAQSLIRGETLDGAIDRIQTRGDLEWYAAERIARTESAHAFNQSANDSIEVAREVLPDITNRWCEHISDITGAPFDNRVAADSVAMHGQIANRGLFTMPPSERVDSKRWNLKFAFPPNRPNDRAVVAPWRPHWGIPAWRWEGRRVEL